MKKTLCMILALLIIACSLPGIVTSYADDSVNLLADATKSNGAVTWTDKMEPRETLVDSKAESVFGGPSWTFGLGYADVVGDKYEYIYIKAPGLAVGANYEFSYIYQRDYIFAIESIKTANGENADFTVPATTTVAEKARSYKVSTTLTVPVNGDYTITLKINRDMRTSDSAWSDVVLGDLSLTKTAEAINYLENATKASGDVTWTTATDVAQKIGNIDSWGVDDNKEKSVNGGYSWSFGLGDGNVKGDVYAYVYIKAKGLTANTKYDFSYIYQKDFIIAFDRITDKDGAVVELETASNDVAIVGGDRAHQVFATFVAPADGDYTITLKTNRDMLPAVCQWSHVVLSDLVLIKSTAAAKVAAEVLVSGNGDATVSDDMPAIGSQVTYTAAPWPEEEFLGWYNGDVKVSDNLVYSFPVTEKVTLTAKFTSNNLNVLAGKKASDWTGWHHLTVSDSTESKNGGKGYLLNKVMWQSMYTTVTLKANTKYDFSFNWKGIANEKGVAFPSEIMVYPVNAADINDRANNWSDNGDGGLFKPKTGTDLEQGGGYATEDMAKTYQWQSVNTAFTTTNETEYNVIVYFTINGTPGEQAINVSDFVLRPQSTPVVPPVNPPAGDAELSEKNAADWATWNYSKISDSTESNKGGKGYLVEEAMYQSIATELTLKPNTTYNFSFDWKAVANDKGNAYPSVVGIYSSKSGTIPPAKTMYNNTEAPSPYPANGYENLLQNITYPDVETADLTAWNTLSGNFTTGADTNYYLTIAFARTGETGPAGNNKQKINLSDFVLTEKSTPVVPPVNPPAGDAELSEKTAADWRGVRWSKISDSTEATPNGGKAYRVDDAMNQNINTTLALKPNTQYKISFSWKAIANDKGLAYLQKASLFSAKSGNPELPAADENDPNWGAACNYDFESWNDYTPIYNPNQGYSDLMTDIVNGYNSEDTSTWTNWNGYSAKFTTTEDTEYYFFINFGLNGSNGKQAVIVGDFVLEELGEAQEPQIPALSEKDAADWRGVRWSKITNSTEATPNGGKAYRVDDAMNQNINTTLALKPNTQYKISFSWKALANDKGLAYLAKASIYSAKSGNPELPAVDENDPNWGAACNYDFESWNDYTPIYNPNEGYSDLMTDIVNGYNSEDTSTWTNWNGYSAKFTTTGDTEYYFFINFGLNGSNGKQAVVVGDFVLEELGGAQVPSIPALSEKDATDWTGYEWSTIENSNVSRYGGKAYLVKKAMFQNIYTLLSLKPNTKYNLSFEWKSVANEQGPAYPNEIYVTAKNDVDLKDTNNWESSNFKGVAYDLEIGGSLDNSEAALTYDWQNATVSFNTKEDTEYNLLIHFQAGGNGQQEIYLSDFKLEDLGSVEGDENADPDNLAAKYTAAGGNVTWTENADPHADKIDRRSDIEGGYSWGFGLGLADNDYEQNPAYITIKTHELEANHKYEFSFSYQKDFIIALDSIGSIDSIDSDVEIIKEAEDVKLLEGDRAHRVTVRFATTKAGVHNIKLKTGKHMNNENCQWSHTVLCDLKLYDITNRVYGSVKSELGGTVSGFDAAYCTKGDKIVLTATPRSGNTFKGWYDEAGKLVSENAVFEFTAESNFNYLAVFEGTNIPNDEWLKKHGMDGTFENGLMEGWKAEDRDNGDDTSWAMFDRSDDMAYNGNYSLKIRARYRTSFFRFNDLKKSTNYVLSFYVNHPDLYVPKTSDEQEPAEYNEEAVIRWFSVTSGGATLYHDSGSNIAPAIKGGSGWYKVNIYFNTADFTSVDWNFYYTNKNGAEKEFIYMDDISLTEYTSNTFTNGNFASGAAPWRGEFSVTDGVASVTEGNSIYQNTELGTQALYTVSFKAKGKGVAGAAQITTNPFDATNHITSESTVNINSTDWNNYSYTVFSGINPDAALYFKSTSGTLLVDDVTVTKAQDRSGAIVEKIDFESDRFAPHVKSDVFEIYNGTAGDANVHSGTKSLRFNSAKAQNGISYLFEEAFVSAQVVPKINYRLTMYYKTAKGNSIYLAPEHLPDDETVETVYTAADNGWTQVDFMFNKSTTSYIKTVIGNVLGKTNGDFYIDDITLTIAPPMVLETDSIKKYCEWPLNVLNNEGFEKNVTASDWANLPKTAVVRTDNGANGKNYLRVNGGTHYVLPVQLEASDNYYLSVSSRLGANSSGFVAITSDPQGTAFYNNIDGVASSKITVDSGSWNRDSFLFSTSETGMVYLVFSADKGYIDLDDVHIYKRQYGWETDPNDHTEFIPFNYDNPDPSTIVYNGGDPTYGGVIDPEDLELY